MKITALEEYGLRCLLQLAREPSGSLVTVSEIAHREALSNEYVSKIMTLLRRGGLVESVRGVTGGYRLVKSSGEITIADLSFAVSHPLFDEGFCNNHKGLSTECVHADLCGVRNVWQMIADKVQEAMKSITLDQIISKQKPENIIGVVGNENRAISH
jgi:Rrf2 family protein